MIRILILLIIFTSCSKAIQPQVLYTEKIISKIDTLTFIKDSVPCNNFEYSITNKLDTIFVKVSNKKLNIKTIKQTDTIYKTTNVIEPIIIKKIKNKAKDNSAIGENNKLKKTTKKSQWFWIFVAGFLTAHLIRLLIKSFKINI